jgi:hypothetical protein
VKRHLSAVVTAGVLAFVGTAYLAASPRGDEANHLKARMDGYQEVPAISSTGTGTLDLRIDDDAQSIEFELAYENLEGATTTASHIHLGQPSVNGGVSVFFCGGGGRPPCTPTSGSFSGVITPANVVGPAGQGIAATEFDELVRALRAGATYVNVHTDKHPGGEIRGLIK